MKAKKARQEKLSSAIERANKTANKFQKQIKVQIYYKQQPVGSNLSAIGEKMQQPQKRKRKKTKISVNQIIIIFVF